MQNNETNRDRRVRHIDANLDDQYRPIGIGAVAGALTAGKTAGQPKTTEQSAPGAANNNDRQHDHESLAA